MQNQEDAYRFLESHVRNDDAEEVQRLRHIIQAISKSESRDFVMIDINPLSLEWVNETGKSARCIVTCSTMDEEALGEIIGPVLTGALNATFGEWMREVASNASEGRLTFPAALAALKAGKLIAREGWNGSGMWLRIQVSSTRDWQSYIQMKTAQGTLVPWCPSQTDLLANDWMIVEGGDQ